MLVDRSGRNSRIRPRRSRLSPFTATFVLALILFSGSFIAEGKDRVGTMTPSNFRVTALTPFSAALAWTPHGGNPANFTYRLWSTAGGGSGGTVTLPGTATSYTWNTGMAPRNFYTFGLYAVDGAGNASGQVTLSVTTPPDTTPPSGAPVVSVTDIGYSYISLAWTPAQDDGPFLFYQVWLNGSPYAGTGTERTITLHLLAPATTYTVNVRAYDYGNNWSPLSKLVTVTTAANTLFDGTPPTTPTNLREDNWCDEVHLRWSQSTDNIDAQSLIRYDVYVNGVLDHYLFGSGGPAIVYGIPGQQNTFKIIAVDTAGNPSVPAILTVNLCN
jgi:chitodextrinase